MKKEQSLILRRTFSDQEKMAILADASDPNANVSEVARKHKISPSLLFAWRNKYCTAKTENPKVCQDEAQNSLISENEKLKQEVRVLTERIYEYQAFVGKKLFESEGKGILRHAR